MRSLVLIAHNIRSTHNVGSLLRTADGLGVDEIVLTGYTPYPLSAADTRLPHIAQKLHNQIHKTALGAEHSVSWRHSDEIIPVIAAYKKQDYTIAALEQARHAVPLPRYTPCPRIVLIVGREVEGLEAAVIKKCDVVLEIPMYGSKESYNVVQAAAMALYHCRFTE